MQIQTQLLLPKDLNLLHHHSHTCVRTEDDAKELLKKKQNCQKPFLATLKEVFKRQAGILGGDGWRHFFNNDILLHTVVNPNIIFAKKYRSWHNVILSKEERLIWNYIIYLHSMRFLKTQEFQNIFFLHSRRKLTFWSAFSFSSKLWVAVSRLVWVWANSFSSCCIFFSRASTSSFA